MPIHDWTRVPPGLFHHFHQDWSIELARALNRGRLPDGMSALVEQRVDGPEPDVIAVESRRPRPAHADGTVLTLEPPRTRMVRQIADEAGLYARKANRIAIRHALGDVVAVIELVSPGNKSSRAGLQSFVDKSVALLRRGIHLLAVDLFPPSPRDPQGIHAAIAEAFGDDDFALPAETPLTLVSYRAAGAITAYIECAAVGRPLPEMPLFLTPDAHVPTPLEATYQATWDACPAAIRELLTAPET